MDRYLLLRWTISELDALFRDDISHGKEVKRGIKTFDRLSLVLLNYYVISIET